MQSIVCVMFLLLLVYLYNVVSFVYDVFIIACILE